MQQGKVSTAILIFIFGSSWLRHYEESLKSTVCMRKLILTHKYIDDIDNCDEQQPLNSYEIKIRFAFWKYHSFNAPLTHRGVKTLVSLNMISSNQMFKF